MENNTTTLPNIEYYRLKRFYDTVKKGEHVVIYRGGIGHCSPDIEVYGNTDKIDQILRDRVEKANQLVDDYKSKTFRLEEENKEIDRKCIKLKQDIESLEGKYTLMFNSIVVMINVFIIMLVLFFY